MRTRIATGAVLVGILGLFLVCSHVPWVPDLTVACLSGLAAGELGRAVGTGSKLGTYGAGALAGLLLAQLPGEFAWALLGLALIATVLVGGKIMHRLPNRLYLHRHEKLLLGCAIPVLFSAIKQLQLRPFGLEELTLSLLVCSVTDSFAYLIGRKFGKRKLAEAVSPKKTVEGGIGGTAAALVLLIAVSVASESAGVVRVHYGLMTLFLLTASLLGQYGDLCLSAVKRAVGIKDFGTLLPGHGGILDRFDSHLLVLPYTYLFCCCFGSMYY